MQRLLVLLLVLGMVLSTKGQDILLLSEDFEGGAGAFTLNSGGPSSNTGNNLWIVNNVYSGAPTYPNTTPQNVTNGGTISFAPTSNYLHIHNQPSGITNANYDPAATSDRFTELSGSICTFGFEEVHFSFFYLCEGSADAYGTIWYSADGGPWTQFGQAQYNNQSNWQYVDITLPAFEDVGDLRFGFRWQNGSTGTPLSQSFAIDDINIVASYSETDPVEINVTAISPNPVCQGNFVSISYELSEPLCDGNYQIYLSTPNGTFPGPYGSWVFPINYPTTSGTITVQIPDNAPPGDCYRFRIDRTSPPPAITGIASFCFEIEDCPNEIETMQPAVTLDTNAVCIGSAIDVPFTSTGIYLNGNNYIAQLSEPDGTFAASPPVIGSWNNNGTYDPVLGDLPGSVSGIVPETEPGCGYYIRVVSTNPEATVTEWGPFCIQQCDITTNDLQDISLCLYDCETEPEGQDVTISIEVNSYNTDATYGPGNVFTTQLLSSMDFSQIGEDGILGEVEATGSTELTIHIPCTDSLADYGIPLGMNYLRIVATESSEPDNSLGTLIRLTIGQITTEPQIIQSFEYPLELPRDTFCVGEVVHMEFTPFNLADNSTFQWQSNGINGGQPFTSPSGPTSNDLYVNLGAPATLWFTIQETNYGCVSEWVPRDTIIVLGNPAATITGPTSICMGDTAVFEVPFSPGTYYSWTNSALPNQIAYQDTSNNEANIVFDDTGSFTLSINTINLCGSASDTHNVNVLDIPDISAGEDEEICVGQSVTLQADSPNGSSYEWFDQDGTVGSGQNLTVSPDSSQWYAAEVTGAGGCDASDSLWVEVVYPDDPIELNDGICPGGGNLLELQAPQDGDLEWFDGSQESTVIVSDTGSYSLSIEVPGELCPVLYEFVIEPLTPDPPTFFNDSVCPGDLTEIFLSAPSLGNYEWSTGSTSATISVSDPGTHSLEVFGGLNPCPESFVWVVDSIQPPATVSAIDSVCPGGFYPIDIGFQSQGSQYYWSTGDIAPFITVNDTGVYILEIFTPGAACTQLYEWTLYPDTCLSPPVLDCHIPNSFTPNNDFINDLFYAVFSDLSLVEEFEMMIFDRWGEKIFETTDPTEAWVGNYKDGEYYVEPEVFIYMVRYKSVYDITPVELQGHVVLIR